MKKVIKCFIIFIVLLIAIAGIHYWISNNYSESLARTNYLIVGHRGGAKEVPENTLAAINHSLNNAVDLIEIDVHQSADNVVCVMHDTDVNRTTNGKGKIKDLSWEQIKQLDAGSFFSPEFKGEKVPSLEQVLNKVSGRAQLLIEIKHGNKYYPGMEERVVELIKQHKAEKWCIVQSFNGEVLKRIHKMSDKIRLHKLDIFICPKLNFAFDGSFHSLWEADYIESYNVNWFFLSEGVVENMHVRDKQVFAWTLDNSAITNKIINMGVDGIITDIPASYSSLRKKRK